MTAEEVLRVTAPLVQAMCKDGVRRQFYLGAALDGAEPAEVDRLASMGLIGMVPAAPPPEAWPAPPSDDDDHVRPIAVTVDGKSLPAEARLVKLWGATVAVDEDDHVFCGRCRQFVPVADLRPDTVDHDVDWRPGWERM